MRGFLFVALVLIGCGGSGFTDADRSMLPEGGAPSAAGNPGVGTASKPGVGGSSTAAGSGGAAQQAGIGSGPSGAPSVPVDGGTGGAEPAEGGSAGAPNDPTGGAGEGGAGGHGGEPEPVDCVETKYPTCSETCPLTFRGYCGGALPVWLGPEGTQYQCGAPVSPGDGPDCAAAYGDAKRAKDECCAAQ